MFAKTMIQETYEVSSFTKLVLRDDAGGGAVTIEQGSVEGLQIEAKPELLRRIEVEVRNGTLYIRLGGSLMELLADKLTTSLNRHKIIFRLQVKELQSAKLTCASALYIPSLTTQTLDLNLCGLTYAEVDGLEADRLELNHSGMGSLEFSGTVQHQDVRLGGAGIYDASELLSESAVINVSGSTHARVNVSETLDATIHGMGVVEYRGRPRVRRRVFGMGSIRRVGA